MCHWALSQLLSAIVQGQQAERAANLKLHQCSFTAELFPRTRHLGHRVRSPLLITQRKSTWFCFLSIALVSLWDPDVVPGVLASSPGLCGPFGGLCILCVKCRLTSASKCLGFFIEGEGWIPRWLHGLCYFLLWSLRKLLSTAFYQPLPPGIWPNTNRRCLSHRQDPSRGMSHSFPYTGTYNDVYLQARHIDEQRNSKNRIITTLSMLCGCVFFSKNVLLYLV